MITGHTLFAPLLAHPCTHVRTPGVFNAGWARRGIAMVMVPFDIPPQGLADLVAALRGSANLAGFVVTIPHKTPIAAHCDRLQGAAEMLGVCNVVRKEVDGTLTGAMFDGDGFVAGLRHCGHDPAGRRALLIGAKGAASGVAHALVVAGVARLTILNRSVEKAAHLAGLLRARFPDADIRVGAKADETHDLVINGTSLGMKPRDPLPMPTDDLPAGALVAEVVMQPDLTPFLDLAKARGHAIRKGIHMVEQQVNLLIDFLRRP
jgi:shikimate dehydrogenase